MKVIIFGATGAIGLGLVDILSTEQPEWEIFAVSRNDSNRNLFSQYSNVKLLKGDPNDKDDTMTLCADKDLIYSTVGFPKYEAKYWAEHWPICVDNLLAASSQKQGQKFVFCDNLYAYIPGRYMSPLTTKTVQPSLKSKPGVRALIRQKFQERMDKRPESIAVVGGADFFGPGITNMSFFGDTFTKPIVSGKSTPLMIGSRRKIHDFCFSKDFSKALYLAGKDEKANGKFWICPHSIKGKTPEQIAKDIARIASKGKVPSIFVLPGWAIRILGIFDSFMSEMVEMLPLWQQDYSVDDSDFCIVFGVEPTPYETALTEYVDFYRGVLAG